MRATASRAGFIAAAAVFLWVSSAAAINVTVNQGTQYQTIEGIGAMINDGIWRVRSGPFYINVNLDSVGYWDSLVIDAGYSMLRADPVSDFQPTQGNFSLNSSVRTNLANQAKMVRAARRSGQVFRILWSAWTPPAWMKANNSCCQISNNDLENYLLPANYAAYGAHWVKLLELARDTFDFVPYAISLQNEPLFNEPYVSCNYGIGPGCGWNGVCYNNMFKVTAPVIKATFPDVKIVASEDLNRTTVESALRNDPISNPLVYAWATHNDFVSTFAYWNDRPIWNTEPHANSFMSTAQMLMSNLAAGASAYTEWERHDDCEATPTTDLSCAQAGTYRALKMYARYVRPGAKRIMSGGGVSGSYGVMAFYHSLDTCLTIVMVNGTGTAETANLSVSGSYQPASFKVIQSTGTTDEVDMGTVAINGSVQLAPNSITTLVAGKYQTTNVVDDYRLTYGARARRASASGPRYVYSLDGRLVRRVETGARSSGALARGVYCTSNSKSAARLGVIVAE